MCEIDEIKELLKKKGWEHHQGQPMPNTTTTEVHHFIKDKTMIDVVMDEVVDDATLEAIRGD